MTGILIHRSINVLDFENIGIIDQVRDTTLGRYLL